MPLPHVGSVHVDSGRMDRQLHERTNREAEAGLAKGWRDRCKRHQCQIIGSYTDGWGNDVAALACCNRLDRIGDKRLSQLGFRIRVASGASVLRSCIISPSGRDVYQIASVSCGPQQ